MTVFGAVALNVWLIVIIPKSFFPEQDTGRITATLVADQSISFQLMSQKFRQMMAIVQSDPAVEAVVGFTGAGGGGSSAQTNTGSVYVSLKPLSERDGVDKVMARLRRKLGQVPGGRLYLNPVQDIRIGGRSGNAEYQYTLLGDNTAEVYAWGPKLLAAVQNDPALADVSSDQQQRGLETYITVDRDTASRLGLTMYQIDNTLYDAFGQRSVSTIYSALNQYHVVMEVAPRYWQRPAVLRQFWVSTSGGQASGSETSQMSAGSVTGGSQLAVATASVASTAAVSQPLSSATASAANPTFALASNVAPLTSNAVSLAVTQLQLQQHVQRGLQQRRPHCGAGHDHDDRERKRVERARGLDVRRDDDAAAGLYPIRSGLDAACGQSSERVRRVDNLVQSRARKVAERRPGRVSARNAEDPFAG